MAIAFTAAGVQGAVASGDVTPGLPAGWAVNDIHVCSCKSKDNVNATMPAGWTAWNAGTNNGASLRTTLFWRRAQAGDTDPLVSHAAGAAIRANIVGYSGCVTSGDPANVLGAISVNASSTTETFHATGITTTVDNCMVLEFGAPTGETSVSTYSGSPTPTERFDANGTCGADFLQAAAGSTGERSTILTSAKVNIGILVALTPATSVIFSSTLLSLGVG